VDAKLARVPVLVQNAVRVRPQAANSTDSHFITLIVMKRHRLIYRGSRDACYCFDNTLGAVDGRGSTIWEDY
jgi:hypothetical protein